ncbi:hypothetical protein CLOM_g24142 [Closterium sp. NIES-68]|nr:hypothetical protein CLOM_g24142 [Closterium sp. NIES-68]GJP74105.1 hypothetical protein CLOP_g4740 [Closterium sp. NIES-67]
MRSIPLQLRTPHRGERQECRSARPGAQALLDPKSDEILANAIKEPVAFFGGVVAGILRLDLNEEPLRDWVKRTADAAGVAPPTSKELVDEDGDGEIVIEDDDDDSQPVDIAIE